jgi:hypothetical protein
MLLIYSSPVFGLFEKALPAHEKNHRSLPCAAKQQSKTFKKATATINRRQFALLPALR